MATIFLKISAVFIMIMFGVVARRRHMLDAASTRHMAHLLTNLIYPCLIFSSVVTQFSFGGLLRNWALPAGALLVMATGNMVGRLALAVRGTGSRDRDRVFLFHCTINNYSFLPMPLAYLLWGEAGLALLVFSTLGSELAVWTLGVQSLSGDRLSVRSLRHVLNVPVLALFGAVGALAVQAGIASLSGTEQLVGTALQQIWSTITWTLDLFGKGTIPIAMIIAGSRMAALRTSHVAAAAPILLAALRLLLIPAVVAGLLALLPFSEASRHVLLLVAVMPCAVTSVTLTEFFGGDADFAAAGVLVTHVGALLTVPIWLALLGVS